MIVFALLAGLAAAVTRYTACEETWERKIEYLDRVDDLRCFNEPLRGFQLLNLDQSKCGGAPQMKWKFECGGGATMDKNSVTEAHTMCNDMVDRPIVYLDRHWLACPTGTVMYSWKALHRDQCTGNNMKFAYECAKATYTDTKEVMTACSEGRTADLQNLDRHPVMCPAGYAIKEFGVVLQGCASNALRYKAVCVNAKKPVGGAQQACLPLPSQVLDCTKYKAQGNSRECYGKGAGCIEEAGWFSKENTQNPNQRINAQLVCLNQGYDGMDDQKFGGNWGHQCRIPGNSINSLNKAGGTMIALGYTVAWKCKGTQMCNVMAPTAPPTNPPTNPPTKPPTAKEGCADLPSPVVDCTVYKNEKGNSRECVGKGAGCIEEGGWFSKDNTSNPNQRINAQQVCKQQGYEGMDTQKFGGNWGHQCRIPGNSLSSLNKGGGQATALGYTVAWKCTGTQNCGKVPTAPPTKPPVACGNDLPNVVQDCGKYVGNSRECLGQGQKGCVGEGWFSKENTTNPNQRVNVIQICKDAGYAEGADPNEFGGNWGHQCRYPSSGNSPNKAGGQLTALGYTVSWKCKGEKQCGPTPPPTKAPTAAPPTNPPTNPPTAPPTKPIKCKDATTVEECKSGFCKAKEKKGKLKSCKQLKCKKEFKKDMKKKPPVTENCAKSPFCKVEEKKSKKEGKDPKVSCKEIS